MKAAYGVLSLAVSLWFLYAVIDAALKLHIWPFQ